MLLEYGYMAMSQTTNSSEWRGQVFGIWFLDIKMTANIFEVKRWRQLFWYGNNCRKKSRCLPGIDQRRQLYLFAQAFLLPCSD